MPYIWSVLAGLGAGAAYHPIKFWPALLVGISTLYYLNREQAVKERIKCNYLFGVGFQILTLHWIGTYVGSFAWLLLVAMQATFFALLSFTKGPLGFASSWIAFEFLLRTFPFGGFGWSRLGFALTESPFNYLYSKVSIVGVAFLFVLIIGQIIERRFKGIAFTAFFLLVIALIPNDVNFHSKIKVALVQGGQTEKLDNTFENSEGALSKHFLAMRDITPKSVDLVIWPENAVMHDPTIRRSTRAEFASEVKRISAPILVNANLSDGTNGSLLIGADSKQIYSKRYLTPFGEFIPLRSLVEKLSDKTDKVVGYIPGKEPYLFKTKNGDFRTLICYELLSDKQARSEMSDADFIVTQTNNATYFKTWQLEQELAIAQARSAETSRQSAYVSTTGITAIINEHGRVTNSYPKYANGALIDNVQTRTGVTSAVRYGNWIEFTLLGLWLLLLVSRRTFRN